jgi:hypothetical protein
MRILLDENLDWRLRRDLPGHVVESVPMDGSMVHQQNLSRHRIAVVALRAKSNRLSDTRPLMAELLARVSQLQAGTLTFLGDSK